MDTVVKDIVDSCLEIADKINSEKLKKTIREDIHFLSQHEKKTITFVGQPFSELFEILYAVLGINPIFSKQIRKISNSYVLKFGYAQELFFKTADSNSVFTTIERQMLENRFLVDNEDFSNHKTVAEVGLEADLLKDININLICSKDNFEDINWISEFTKTDYVVFVLNATALLSLAEKKFLRASISNILGENRFAILINNIDKVEQAGRLEVEQLVEYFFHTNENKVPLFYYSVHSVLKAQEASCGINAEYIKFHDFITKQWVAEREQIREKAIKQNLKICIDQVEKISKQIEQNLTYDKTKLEKAIYELRTKSSDFDKKKASTKRRMEMFVNGTVKIDFIDKIEQFNELLKQDIEQSIKKENDLERSKKNIYAYIENVWKVFFENQQLWLKNSIYAQVNDVYRSIQSDVMEMAADLDQQVCELIIRCLSNKYNFDMVLNAKIKADNWEAELSKYLSIGGVALFLVNIPLAIFTVGTAQFLKLVFKDNIEDNKKEKLISMVFHNCEQLKEDMISAVNTQFKNIIDSLSIEADATYDRLLNILIDTLEQQKKLMNDSEAMLAYLEQLEKVIIPELKQKITNEVIKELSIF